MIHKRMSVRGVHRVKSIEHASADLMCASECDVFELFHSSEKLALTFRHSEKQHNDVRYA